MHRSTVLLLAAALGLSGPALARAEPTPARAVAAEEDSPRSALARYLEACREGDYAAAARELDLSAGHARRGPELARRLKAVLDRHVWLDLDLVSDKPEGNLSDGLAPNLEQLAQIAGPQGSEEPVRMVRTHRDGRSAWLFTAGTVGRVDEWYARLPRGGIAEHLPKALLRSGPLDLLLWQWLALPVLLLLAWALAVAAARLTTAVLARAAARTTTTWDDALIDRLGAPATLAWWLALTHFGLRLLDLNATAAGFLSEVLRSGGVLVLFWALLRSADIFGLVAAGSPWATTHPLSRSLLPLAVRSSKIAIFAMAAVGILSVWGFPVASLLAGLGIGGLALALAAQKTVENLFGSFSIGVDQPLREGDFVRVDDIVGTVETIGLRSTRFRTLDRTIVTLPNGKLADMKVESFAPRDRIRFACALGLVYGTTAEQMRAVLAGVERVLRAHPKLWPQDLVVRFKGLGVSSLEVEVVAFFATSDWGEFQAIRQEVLLGFMEVVESSGSSFAFPTQTVHLVEGPSPGAAGAGAPPPREPAPGSSM